VGRTGNLQGPLGLLGFLRQPSRPYIWPATSEQRAVGWGNWGIGGPGRDCRGPLELLGFCGTIPSLTCGLRANIGCYGDGGSVGRTGLQGLRLLGFSAPSRPYILRLLATAALWGNLGNCGPDGLQGIKGCWVLSAHPSLHMRLRASSGRCGELSDLVELIR